MRWAAPDPRKGGLTTLGSACRPAGFTLIELMIVIGIIAIIVATGVPPFVKAMRREGLRKAVNGVVEGCSHARALAILQGVPTEFVIRAEDGQMTVHPLQQVRKSEEGSEGGGARSSEGTAASQAAGFKENLPDDIAVKLLYVNFQDQMEYSEAHVRFFPNGTCDEFTVILSCTTGEEQISLDVITALPEVKQIR
jgi:prepilin-type N-terminal cleavage/methylation domain-containing protein